MHVHTYTNVTNCWIVKTQQLVKEGETEALVDGDVQLCELWSFLIRIQQVNTYDVLLLPTLWI